MNLNAIPTKGNLINAKNTLSLARMGYSLMDQKRNILIRELMALIEEAKDIQSRIDRSFTEAYHALQRANIEHGVDFIQSAASSVPPDNGVRIKVRSVMGTEIPLVEHESLPPQLSYSFMSTRESVDLARQKFEQVKELTVQLSMIENSAYRLASKIKKTQKRENALKNITIPRLTALTASMSNALEEKEREEFTRLKVIKRRKTD